MSSLRDIIDLSEDRVKSIILNSRPSKWSAPRWVLVRDLFGCGSASAKQICSYFDLNPDKIIFNPHWPEESEDI